MSKVWCRRKVPEVGDRIRCRREGLPAPAEVLLVLGPPQNYGSTEYDNRGVVRIQKADGSVRNWTVYNAHCEVEREVEDG